MQSEPLQPVDPPRYFPRLAATRRPLSPGDGSVSRFQSSGFHDQHVEAGEMFTASKQRPSSPPKFCDHPPTIWVFSIRLLCRPASMTRTDTLGVSARRPAMTEPDVPPLMP